MCGFSGIVSMQSSIGPGDVANCATMAETLVHRGPDGYGAFHNRNIAVAHRRLAIIDRDLGGQPFFSGCNRYFLVFNGEIYNYLELKKNLLRLGVSFSTQSDTEVLLYLLMAHGPQALSMLNGMYAFFFYDIQTHRWLAARDHFGIKPFYYCALSDRFLFASEIKALLAHPELGAERNDEALGEYLTLQFCLSEKTLFKNIQKIEPGSYLTGTGSRIETVNNYWQLRYEVNDKITQLNAIEEVNYLINDSLRMQVHADVGAGAYLSGGVDSSLVSSLAAEYLGPSVPVFTGKFLATGHYDESEYAKEVARCINAQYYEIAPTEQDFVSSIERIIYMMDEPLAGPGVFPQFMVSQLASKHVKVVLGGQGGDEVFGGYARYLVAYLEQALKGAIFETQEEGRHLVSLENIIPSLPLLQQYVPLMKNFWQEGLFDSMDTRYFRLVNRMPETAKMLQESFSEKVNLEHIFSKFKNIFNRNDTKSYINKMTHFDIQTLLPALLHVEDRMSMSASIEARVPLLDHRLVEFMAAIPPAIKFKGGVSKAILKAAARNSVPSKVLNRKDKMGFPVPLREWVKKGVVRDFVGDILLSQSAMQRGIFKPEALLAMVDSPGCAGRQLWGALSLELWHQQYLD